MTDDQAIQLAAEHITKKQWFYAALTLRQALRKNRAIEHRHDYVKLATNREFFAFTLNDLIFRNECRGN